MSELIQLGLYQHYKGNRYRVLGTVRHSESLDVMVVYQALYGNEGHWVRPLAMFQESVEHAGKTVPRFKFISAELPTSTISAQPL